MIAFGCKRERRKNERKIERQYGWLRSKLFLKRSLKSSTPNMIAFGCKRERRKNERKIERQYGWLRSKLFLKYRYFSDFFVAAKHCYQGEELKSTESISFCPAAGAGIWQQNTTRGRRE